MEVLRTVVADVDLGQITLLVVIGGTSHEADISARDVGVGARIVFLALVVEHEAADAVPAESARIIERGLEVPVTCLAERLRVAERGVLSGLAVLHAAVRLDDRRVARHSGGAGLGGGEDAVVRPLDLERQTLGDELEILVEGEVHLEFVDIAGYVSADGIILEAVDSGERQGEPVGIVGGRDDILAVHESRTRERGGEVDVADHACGPLSGARLVGVVDIAGDIEGDLGRGRHVEVEVGAIVKAVVLVAQMMRRVEFLEEAALIHEAGGDEVLDPLGAAGDVDAVVGLGCDLLHHIIRPLHAREADRVGLVEELLDDGRREHLRLVIVDPHLIVEDRIVV